MIPRIRPADPKEADILSRIAFAAKSHWGYPQRWLEIWAPQLTFIPEYFEENESWVAVDEERPIGFYTFWIKTEAHGLKTCGYYPTIWAKE